MAIAPEHVFLTKSYSTKPLTNVLVPNDHFGFGEETSDVVIELARRTYDLTQGNRTIWSMLPDENDGSISWGATITIAPSRQERFGEDATLVLAAIPQQRGTIVLLLTILTTDKPQWFECTIPDTGHRDPEVLYRAMMRHLKAALSIISVHTAKNGTLYSREDIADWGFALSALAMANRGTRDPKELRILMPSPLSSAAVVDDKQQFIPVPQAALDHINAQSPAGVMLTLRDHHPERLVMLPMPFGMEAFGLEEAGPMELIRLLADCQAKGTLPADLHSPS